MHFWWRIGNPMNPNSSRYSKAKSSTVLFISSKDDSFPIQLLLERVVRPIYSNSLNLKFPSVDSYESVMDLDMRNISNQFVDTDQVIPNRILQRDQA